MNARAKSISRHLNRAPEIFRCARHSGAWLPLAARYTGLQQDGFPFVARFRDGSTFEFQNIQDLATWWQIFYRGVYPVKPSDRVIVDAGANIGAFTLYALRQSPHAKVIAIEPFPATFARLSANLERSPLRARVQLVNAALSSQGGTVTMQDGDIASQFRRVVADASNQAGTAVKSCTLPEVFAQAEGDIDFLKMDIEGGEYASILTSPPEVLGRIKRLAMELHPPDERGAQPQDLFRHLAKAGLETTEVQDHGDGYGMAYLRRA